jgi:ribonuclease J
VARIEFWGGVGVIGSSKVLIHDGGHRVLLDLGLDIPRGTDLFRGPAAAPPGRELSARLRLGAAPAIAGLYDPAALDPGDPLGEPAAPTAVFISHPHIDHVGLAGFLRPDIPAYAAPDGIALLAALQHSGETLPGPRDFTAAATSWRPAEPAAAVRVGPIAVERLDVDHDVPGASGYRITTSDGVLAFTGDLRFHGHHPERSWAFADAVAGCDVLVTEGTTLSFDEHHPVRTEADVARDYAAALDGSPDLMLQSVYPRDLERVRAFTAIAAAAGRTILWPARVAAFLEAAGAGPAATADQAGRAAVRADPGRFVIQLDAADLPGLLDLPIGPASVMLHANGEPLGPFDPRWPLYTDWLDQCGLPLRSIGCSGHAAQDDLHEMLYRIRPPVVVPIHTRSPYRLHPVGGTARLVVDYARAYDFAGRPLPDRD